MLASTDQKEDLRVRRTRLLIYNAFVDLLNEKAFPNITVQDIANRAMVNRATFYAHFADKYALFEYALREMFRETLESKLPTEFDYCSAHVQLLISTVCEFLVEVERHCSFQVHKGLPPFNEQITGLVSEAMRTWWLEKEEGRKIESAELMVDVVSWAIYGAARHWSRQKLRTLSADAFARQVMPMIAAIIVNGADMPPPPDGWSSKGVQINRPIREESPT